MEHTKSILSQILRMSSTSSDTESHPTDILDWETSKTNYNQLLSEMDIVRQVSSLNVNCIKNLQNILIKDSEFRKDITSKNETKVYGVELVSLKLKLALAINTLNKKYTGTASSFSAILKQKDVVQRKISISDFYSFFIIRILHLKLIDYQNQLMLNGEKTTQKCNDFLMKAFSRHITDNFIIDRQNGIEEFSSQFTQLQGYLDDFPENVDCTLWHKQIRSFRKEIVRIYTSIYLTSH